MGSGARDACLWRTHADHFDQIQAEAGGLLFVAADTEKLPFADDQFQLVTVAFGLRNMADWGAALREIPMLHLAAAHLVYGAVTGWLVGRS